MIMLRLAGGHLLKYRVRFLLTVCAVALSTSLVVAVTSGYESLRQSAQRMLALYMGTTDAQLTRRNEPRGGIDQSVADQIAKDPSVKRVDGRLEIDSGLMSASGNPIAGRAAELVGIDRPGDTRVDVLKLDAGRWFSSSDGNEVVIDQVASQRLNVKLGDTFFVPGANGKLELRVVGVVHKPGILAQAIQTIYVPLHTLQNFSLPEKPAQVSRLMIDLKSGRDPDAFYGKWAPELAKINPAFKLQLASENRRQMDQNLQGLAILSYLGGSVALIASAFIMFSSLSMGVSERQRILATLRALGAFRFQLAQMVLAEAGMIAVAGLAVGVPLGIVLIKALAAQYDELFTAGGVVSIPGTAAAIIGDLVVAIAAGLLPAVAAMRASPVEAMTPLAEPTRFRPIWIAALCGVVILAIDPLLLFLPVNRELQFYGHFTVGLGGMMLGSFLLAPALVLIAERALGPIVSLLVGTQYSLLKQQLSGAAWRAAGCCAALMVGLAVLIAMQVQGQSSIQAWKIPDKFPDVFIFSATGLTEAQTQKLKTIQGIDPKYVMPIAIASPQFGSGMFAILGLALMPDATMYFGIDPDVAFDLMALDFREGSPEQAKAMLKQGQHVIVTQEFRQLKKMHVGSKLPLKTNQGTVDFIVAGVVWSPGIDVINSFQDLGKQFDQRTAASIFGTLDDAKKYFGVDHYSLVAANLQGSIEKNDLIKIVNAQLGTIGLEAGDVRQIKHGIQVGLSRLLTLVSLLAYASMGLAALGVTNTIMASVRSRQWQFGVLRSIGLTRGQLLRLIFAEAILLGVVSILLGTVTGFLLALDARQFWTDMIGLVVPLIIPWLPILYGMIALLVVCLIASVIPAIRTARTDLVSLLQAGRASA